MSGREKWVWQPGMLERVDGLEPCQRVPHEPHPDEHGSCPGYGPTTETERRVDALLEEAAFEVGDDAYGDWFWGVDR